MQVTIIWRIVMLWMLVSKVPQVCQGEDRAVI